MKSRKGVSAALTVVITIVVLIVVALSVILIVTGGLGRFGGTVSATANPAACQTCLVAACPLLKSMAPSATSVTASTSNAQQCQTVCAGDLSSTTVPCT